MTTYNNPFAYAQQRKAGAPMFNTPYSNATVPTAAATVHEDQDFNFVADQPVQEETAAFMIPETQAEHHQYQTNVQQMPRQAPPARNPTMMMRPGQPPLRGALPTRTNPFPQ
jgi:flagellar biosynthesis protein FliP